MPHVERSVAAASGRSPQDAVAVDQPPPGSRRRLGPGGRAGVVAALAAFVAFVAWGLAVPVGGGPDEPGHVVKAAAAVRGTFVGTPTGSPGVQTFVLPADVGSITKMTCFAFRPAVSATCMPAMDSFGSEPTPAISGVGSYNPLYYLLIGWPSLVLTGQTMVLAMRMVAAALAAVFVGITFWAAGLLPRNAALLAAVVAFVLTPTTYFLTGVVNPNGLEVSVVLAFTVLVLAAALRPELLRRRSVLLALATSAALASNLRASTPAFLLMALVVGLLIGRPIEIWRALRTRRAVAILGPAVLVCVAGLVWSVAVSGPAGYIPVGDDRPGLVAAFLGGLARTRTYVEGAIGMFGWLDTPAPWEVRTAWIAAALVPAAVALSVGRGRRLLAAVLMTLALLLGPALVQAPLGGQYGYIWQGRYGIALYGVALAVLAVVVGDRRPLSPVTVRRVVLGAWSIASVLVLWCLLVVLHRFMVGVDTPWAEMSGSAAWRPPLAWWLIVVAHVVGSAGLAAAALLVQRVGDVRSR